MLQARRMGSWAHFQAAAALLTLVLVPAATAQTLAPECGSVETDHQMHQYQNERAILYSAYTCTDMNLICGATSRVERWTWEIGGASTHQDSPCGSVWGIQPVPTWGNWSGVSKHWVILYGLWYPGPNRATSVSLVNPSPEEGLEPWDPGSTPVVLSPVGRFEFTAPAEGVLFDLDADGVAELTAWSANDDTYFLVFDRNGNGLIDSGAELFGSRTPAYPSPGSPTTRDGFQALAFLENPEYGVSRSDGLLDRHDSAWLRLRLWRDVNHNGVSEPDELLQPEEVGLVSLSLSSKTVGRRDRHGNTYRLMGKAKFINRAGQVYYHPFYDVWLRAAR